MDAYIRNKSLYEQETRDYYRISGPVSMTTVSLGDNDVKLILFGDRHHSYDNLCGVTRKYVAHRDDLASFREEAISKCRKTSARCMYITDFMHKMAAHFKEKLTVIVEESPYPPPRRRIEPEPRGPMADVRKTLSELQNSHVVQADIRYHSYFLYDGLPVRNYCQHLLTLYNNFQPDMSYPLNKDLYTKTIRFTEWVLRLMNKTLLEHIQDFIVLKELVGESEVIDDSKLEEDLPLNQVIIREFAQDLEVIKSVYSMPNKLSNTTSASGVQRYLENLDAFNLKFRATLYDFYLAYRLLVVQRPLSDTIITYQGVAHNKSLLHLLKHLHDLGKLPTLIVTHYLLPTGSDEEMTSSRCVNIKQGSLSSFLGITKG